MKIEEILPEIKENVFLKNYTTFKIGGRAKYFFVAKNKNNLIKSIILAKKFNLPFFILGGGSNLLVADEGFNGLVIKNEADNFKIEKEKIFAESGAKLDKIIFVAIEAGLSGLEKGSGIPGTVGGAVFGNSGLGRGDWAIGDVVEKVEILMPNGKIKKFSKKWFSFDYRFSKLKEIKNKKLIILEVILKLKKGEKIFLREVRKKILKKRAEHIPLGFSAGCIFKNPPDFFAGELIEKCGLKGKRIGDVKISEKHANFIINLGNGKAKDVKKLIDLAKKEVKNKFGITLEEEIQYLGF